MLFAFVPAAVYAAVFKRRSGASFLQVSLCLLLSAISFGCCFAAQEFFRRFFIFTRFFALKCFVLNGIFEEFFKIAAILPIKPCETQKKFSFFAGISALTAASFESIALFVSFTPQNPVLWVAARLLFCFPLHYSLSVFSARLFFKGKNFAMSIAASAALHGAYDFLAAFPIPARLLALAPLAAAVAALKKSENNSENDSVCEK